MEMLKDAAKIDLVHIPYKGNAPADRAILAGEVQAVFGSMPALLQNAKAGKVRPLAVGTATRSPALPDVPTVAEQGYPGFEAALWLGIMGPANMPQPSSTACTRRSQPWSQRPSSRPRWTPTAPSRSASKSPEEFREMLRGQVDKYVKITKAIGIKLD